MNSIFYKYDKISDDFDLQEVKDKTIKFISEDWFISKDNENIEWIDFNLEKSPTMLIQMLNVSLLDYYSYVTCLYEDVGNITTLDEDSRLLENEIEFIEGNGVACIYTSVLLYMLLRKSNKKLVKDINFIQGFYHHLLRDDFYSFIPMGKHQQGVHSFLSYKNSLVIDCSAVKQNQLFFKFEVPIILGNKPNGFELYGYEESKEIIFKYASKFSKINFKSIDEWVCYHMKLAKQVSKNKNN